MALAYHEWTTASWAERYLARCRLSCKLGRDMAQSSMTLEQMDALLKWKIDDYQAARKAAEEGHVQDRITIEIQVDFADKGKISEIIKAACGMGRNLLAQVRLLGPACEPTAVVFTDNFMAPAEKIDIFADLIEEGNKQNAELGGISADLLAAFDDKRKGR